MQILTDAASFFHVIHRINRITAAKDDCLLTFLYSCTYEEDDINPKAV